MRSAWMLTAAVLVCGPAAAQNPPPVELRGSYAPGGDCTKEPRVTLDAAALTVQAAGQSTRLAPLDACFSCEGGARYEGIVVWVSRLGPNREPQEPMFYFNAGEKRGNLVVERASTAVPGPLAAAAKASAAAPLRRCAK